MKFINKTNNHTHTAPLSLSLSLCVYVCIIFLSICLQVLVANLTQLTKRYRQNGQPKTTSITNRQAVGIKAATFATATPTAAAAATASASTSTSHIS